MTAHLDTHVAIWLRAGEAKRLRPVARTLARESLRISPAALLELQLLFEIGRLREPGGFIAQRLERDHGVQLAPEQLSGVAARALDLSFTRDPFDRLIAAHALEAGATLLTADEQLLQHLPAARWR